MNLLIIQSVLPKYAISFFNRIVKNNPGINLIVLADVKTKNGLNQYDAFVSSFKVVHLPQIDIFGISFRPGILTILRQINPDIIIFSANSRDASQLSMMVLYRILGRRFYAWGMFHRIGPLRIISRAYYKLASSLATGVLTYSRVGAKTLVDLGVPKKKITIAGTAIDESVPFVQRLSVSPADLERLRSAHDLKNKRIVLQVVRLSRIKKPQLLIAAAEIIIKQRDDVIFVLIGAGELQAELQDLVAKKHIQYAFRFLGPIYNESVLAKWYAIASVFVVPACIGLSAHHAMCYGLPVVTDDSLDEQASEFDILADGLNSLLYKEGDVESLAAALLRILGDDKLAEFLGLNALNTIKFTHNLDNKVTRFCSVLISS